MNFCSAAIAPASVSFTLLHLYPGFLHLDSGSQWVWLLWNEKYSWKHQSKNILKCYYYNHTEHVLSFFVCYFMLVLNITKTWNIRLQYYSNLVVIYYSQEPSSQIIWTWTVLHRVVEMALHTCLWKCDNKGLIIYKLEMMFERKAAITFKPIIYSFKKANNKLLAHTLVR